MAPTRARITGLSNTNASSVPCGLSAVCRLNTDAAITIATLAIAAAHGAKRAEGDEVGFTPVTIAPWRLTIVTGFGSRRVAGEFQDEAGSVAAGHERGT